MRCRVVVLLSGRGSNLRALLQTIERRHIDADVVGVISNRPEAGGLAIAHEAGLTAACIDHREHGDRAAFERALSTTIDALHPDLLLLAGFMRILTPEFVRHYRGRLLNIHPSLLPDHRGLDTHARALARGDRIHGASVHVVTPELDAGPVIAQVVIPVQAGDDPDSLAGRVQQGEHRLYPTVLRWYADGRLVLGEEEVRLDGEILPATGKRFTLEELALAPSPGHAPDGDPSSAAHSRNAQSRNAQSEVP